MTKVLCVIDMQNDFIDMALGSNEAIQTVEPTVQEILNPKYDLVIATMDTHDENYLNTIEGQHLPIKHCIKGTKGWELNEKIDRALNERNALIYLKETFGSDKLVKKLQEIQPEEVTFVGLCTDICVVSNALSIKTFLPNSTIRLIEKCTAGSTVENKEASLQTLRACHIDIF